jgi:hypothetical protein
MDFDFGYIRIFRTPTIETNGGGQSKNCWCVLAETPLRLLVSGHAGLY